MSRFLFTGGVSNFFGGVFNFSGGSPIFGGVSKFSGGSSNFFGGVLQFFFFLFFSFFFIFSPPKKFFWDAPPPPETVNAQLVRILLECILVCCVSGMTSQVSKYVRQVNCENFSSLLPPANEVVGRKCFYTCQSFFLQGKGVFPLDREPHGVRSP